MTFTVPKLPYDFNALEPHIDEKTMQIHHDRHHQAYVDNLNKALEGSKFAEKSIEEILTSLDNLPADKKTAVQNNGGGHYNHSLFWEIMSPEGGGEPKGNLLDAINEAFSSFAEFKEKFKTAGLTRFGSGWAWLVVNTEKELEIVSTPNQDNPISDGKTPILGADVWEHAYYILYKWERAKYLENWWNVVNWIRVEKNYQAAKK